MITFILTYAFVFKKLNSYLFLSSGHSADIVTQE